MKSFRSGRRQYAALPVRISDGSVQVMLITSRDTGRWIIPKGWPMPGRRNRDAAATEAFEEAGITGEILGERRLGSFSYVKRSIAGQEQKLQVVVFLLNVTDVLEDWPERTERDRRWFDLADAAGIVAEPELKKMIQRVPGRVSKLGTTKIRLTENLSAPR